MKRILVLAGAIFALFACESAFAADLAYTTSAANMRSGPTVSSRIVATLGSNTEVRIDNCSDGWCFGRVGGRAGYISSSLLDFDGDTGPTVVERTYVEPEYVYPDTYYAGPSFYLAAVVRAGTADGTMAGIITAGVAGNRNEISAAV